MEMESCVPPGFRFHPTEEELVGYYLNRKVNSLKIDLDVIVDIDLYKMEPWDIQDKCKLGYEEQSEWYFFSHKDRKYPTGTRTNRATNGGFWKATGRDKAVVSKENVIGMRKTLVYYKGRAPNGRKSDWIMHEYRLQTPDQHGAPQEEGWVVCRAFKKPCPSHKQGFEGWSNGYDFHAKDTEKYPSPSFLHHHSSSSFAPPTHSIMNPVTNDIGSSSFQHQVPLDYVLDNQQEMIMSNSAANYDGQIFQLPQLDSPSMSSSLALINEESEDGKTNIYMHQHQQQNDVNFYPSASYPTQNQNSLTSRDDEYLLEYFTHL